MKSSSPSLLCLSCFLAIAACGGDGSSDPDATPAEDAATAIDGSTECVPEPANLCETVVPGCGTWIDGNGCRVYCGPCQLSGFTVAPITLERARAFHVVVNASQGVYVISGTDSSGDSTGTIEYAPYQAGGLGAFSEFDGPEETIADARAYARQMLTDGKIYLMAGIGSGGTTNNILVADNPSTSGGFLDFVDSGLALPTPDATPLSVGFTSTVLLRYGGGGPAPWYIFGANKDEFIYSTHDEVTMNLTGFETQSNPNGEVWASQVAFAAPSLGGTNRQLVVGAGTQAGSPSTAMYTATANPDDSLVFSPAGNLPDARFRGESLVLEPNAYILGGLVDNDAQSKTIVAEFAGDPAVPTFSYSPTHDLNTARIGFGIARVADKVYVIGGRDGINGTYLDSIEVATISPAP